MASKRSLEYGQVVTAVDNIYGRCLARSHVQHHPETHPLRQLEVIAHFVTDLGGTVRLGRIKSAQGA